MKKSTVIKNFKRADKRVMSEIPYSRGILLNYGNEEVFSDLLKPKNNFNTIWGQEYFLLNGKPLMNNADEIIDIMLRCKNPDYEKHPD